MAVLDPVKNLFISRLLKQVLDGNKGSNILGVLAGAIVGADVNYAKALQGYKFDNAENTTELAKLLGAVVLAVFGYFVGKKNPPLPAAAYTPPADPPKE